MSHDNTLGTVTTQIYICRLEDANALWAEYLHNSHYPAEGGYFIRTRSNIRTEECFAVATLVFAANPETGSDGGGGGSHEDGDTEYNFTVSSMERQLESAPAYCVNWNYELLAKEGTTEVPDWWSAENEIELTEENAAKYKWVKPGTQIDGWYLLKGVLHEEGTAIDFRGVEAWADSAPVLVVTKYYRSRSLAITQLLEVNNLKSPPWSGPYDSAAEKWRISNSTVQKSGRYWVCVTTYEYASTGWNPLLYDLSEGK